MSQTLSDRDPSVLTATTPFRFACHDAVPCFTQCCRDVNIYLTPYDVLRLRRALKLSSGEVLARYTRSFLARSTHIPVVQLLMDPQTLSCKLVSDDGCTVYGDRPWACRMYPLDLTATEGEYRMMVGKERCMGLAENRSLTVGEWLSSQGIEPYMDMECAFGAVVPPGFRPGVGMDAGLGKLLFLAYDLDPFAEILQDSRFRTFYDVDDETLRQVTEDDEALLRLAFRYIRSQMDELYQAVS